MFSFIFGKNNSRNHLRRNAAVKSRRAVRPTLECLEDRLLMNSSLLNSSLLQAAAPAAATKNPIVSALAVDLVTTPRQVVPGMLLGPTDAHLYSVQLQNGDFLEADVQTSSSLHLASQMSVLDSHGTVLASVGASADPATGMMSTNPSYGFRAPAAGTYFLSIAGEKTPPIAQGFKPLQILTSGPYSLELHRLALAQGQQDVSTLSQIGSAYAWLNGNMLNISGPTGYGFGIRGNWTEAITRNGNLVSAIYTSTGTSYFETSKGEVQMTGAFSLSTKPQVRGDTFGVIDTLTGSATLSASQLTAAFGKASAFGFDLSTIPQQVTISIQPGKWAGLKLGSDAVIQATGAPVNNAVPYVYFTVNPLGSSATNLLSLVYDPADPALYVEAGVQGLALGPLVVNGIGFSAHGLIPYTPVDAPSQYNGHLGGNVVLQGSFDTTAITVIPSKIVGDITLNFDPNHTGTFLGGNGVTGALMAGIFAATGGAGVSLIAALDMPGSPLKSSFDQVFRNFSVGVNGTLKINPMASFQQDISWEIGNKILGLPIGLHSFVEDALNSANDTAGNPAHLELLSVAHGSLIYDGPTMSAYFRGGTTNPFAGTPLAKFASLNQFTEDGRIVRYLDPGKEP